MTVRVYLDTSVYNRPFDDQTQPRIWLETLAFSVILQMFETNMAILITSSVVAYENSHNPHQLRQVWVRKVMQLASETQQVNELIRQRARILETGKLKAVDALHLACAETARATYFVSVDDRLISRYRRFEHKHPQLNVCDPTEFVRVIGARE